MKKLRNRRWFIKLLLKFRYAFNGIAVAFSTQTSFRIHIVIALLAYILGFICNLELLEWAFVNAAIIFVVVTELFNTAIEHICDLMFPERHRIVRIIKDISAAAVLISVLNAIITGLVIFLPQILYFLEKI